MMRRALYGLALSLLPASLLAQASIFGVRGPGFPGRSYSAETIGSGGSLALFDPESQLSPASLATLRGGTASFTLQSNFRSIDTPGGTADTRDFRFPNVFITAPIHRGQYVFGIGATTYANRDFTLASRDSVPLRGVVTPYTDTTRSQGGLSDLQIAFAIRNTPKTTYAFSAHLITGTDRLVARRAFDDTLYTTVLQTAELSTTSWGLSVGATRELSGKLVVSGLIRKDFTANVNVDSARYGGATQVGTDYGLPWTFAAGVLVRATPVLQLTAQGVYKTWSSANESLVALGAPGSTNVFDLSAGGVLSSWSRRANQFPLRFGAYYATLPFLISSDPFNQPKEFGLSIGTGARFAKLRGGIDMSLERVWRSASGDYQEKAWVIYTTFSIRP